MAKSRRSPRAGKSKAHTDGLKPTFLQSFMQSGFIQQTCDRVGINRSTFVNWLENDPAFARDFEEANQKVTEKYELAAGLRAVEGVRKTVLYQGKPVMIMNTKTGKEEPLYEYEYSDRLLELLLKARDRAKYGERIDYHIDEQAIATAIAARFVSIVRRVAPDVCPGCKTRLDLSSRIAEELLSLSTKVTTKGAV